MKSPATWLTEEELVRSEQGLGCGTACDCDAALFAMGRWALRAREWMRVHALHEAACEAAVCARGVPCTCELRELMEEAT